MVTNWQILREISESQGFVFAECIKLITLPSKSKKQVLWKPILEHAIGYLSNGSKNYILKEIVMYQGEWDNKPYLKFNFIYDKKTIKLLYKYFDLEYKPDSISHLMQKLPQHWFRTLYKDYLSDNYVWYDNYDIKTWLFSKFLKFYS